MIQPLLRLHQHTYVAKSAKVFFCACLSGPVWWKSPLNNHKNAVILRFNYSFIQGSSNQWPRAMTSAGYNSFLAYISDGNFLNIYKRNTSSHSISHKIPVKPIEVPFSQATSHEPLVVNTVHMFREKTRLNFSFEDMHLITLKNLVTS